MVKLQGVDIVNVDESNTWGQPSTAMVSARGGRVSSRGAAGGNECQGSFVTSPLCLQDDSEICCDVS